MGLDSSVYKVKKEDAISDTYFEWKQQEDIAYFRKHNSLNNWMLEQYYMKGGTLPEGEFSVRLTLDDLNKLKHDVVKWNLPSGYDLMSRKDCIIADLRMCSDAKRAIADGYEVYYSADW